MDFRGIFNHVQEDLNKVPEVEPVVEKKSTINRSPERRSKILEHKKYSPLIFKLTRERKELSRKLKVCEKTKDPNRKEYLTRRVNEIDYKLKRLNKKVGINEVEVSGSIWGAHPKARGKQESYIIPKEVMDDYLDKNETAVTDYLMKRGIDIKSIKVMSGAAGTGVAYPVAEKVKEEEMCRCGKNKVEKGYQQCTQCLDKADDEKYRHENESKGSGITREEVKAMTLPQLRKELKDMEGVSNSRFTDTLKMWVEDEIADRTNESKANEEKGNRTTGAQRYNARMDKIMNKWRETAHIENRPCKTCGTPISDNTSYNGLCKKCKEGGQNESKVNEEEGLMSGGATRANDGDRTQDPNFGAPNPVAKPEVEKEPVVEPKPEEKNVEELPLEGEKEYLGNKGGEEYYYFVIVPAEDGTKDLQIQDASDEVVFSAKENQIDPANNEDFLWKGIQELELSNVATEIVDKYLIPEEKPEDIEKEEGRAETGEDQEQPTTEEPKESGVIPELGAPAFKTTVESKKDKKGMSRKMTTIKELKMRRLLCKYELNEDFAAAWKVGDYIDPIGKISEISPEHVRFQDAQGRLTAILLRSGEASALVPPEVQKRYGKDPGKFYNVDVDKMYKTGDVGETKMLERLMEKFGLKESPIDLLLEKYGLNEVGERPVTAPKNVEDLEKATGEKPQTADVPPEPIQPGAEVTPEPGMATPGAVEEPAPLGAEPKAEEMLSSDSAEADLKMKYPEEPYTTTALAYADSLIDEPKVYGAVRNLKWQGVYANAETFLKQAKIVGNYNEFNPDIAKRLVDAVGEGAKYRLAREGSVVVYFTIRDLDKKISLETLKDLVRADEADPTGNDGEARLWWD